MKRSSRLSSVCRLSLSRVRSRKLGEIGAKFRHLCRKSGSSDFAPEVAKYPKSSLKLKIAQNSLAPLAMQLVIIVTQLLFVDAIIVNRH